MYRKSTIFSLLCFALVTALGLYAWSTLPATGEFPIHWNAQGEPDGFGTRSLVLVILLIMPITILFMTLIFWALPKIEPLRENLNQSVKAYSFMWVLTVAFTTAIGALIPLQYLQPNYSMGDIVIRFVAISMPLLFIGIGNVLGKVRRNFFVGIRTPWTLSSELSWEKTHRLGGRLFVGAGVLSLVLAFIAPLSSILAFVVILLLLVVILCVYSYKIWKDDPNKKT